MLDRANEIAAEAHRGQKRKYNKGDYIQHPIRVRDNIFTLDKSFVLSPNEIEIVEIIAILHDVVEDTKWTLDDLVKEGFNEEVIKGVDIITRKGHEDYLAYLKRCYENKYTRIVKRADMIDNITDTPIECASKDKHRLALQLFNEWDSKRFYK